ncbi:MAG: OmpA family protein [Clostridium sp.]|nr:OmpA family protein [Clostridium sp.]
MIKKIVFSIFITASAFTHIHADAVKPKLSDAVRSTISQEELLRPITPTYIRGAVIPSWADNWFVSVSGGVSAFIGSPVGCEDLFGRMEPTFQISIGKWHTPAIGNRISFQGLKWKSGELELQNYRHWHADLLWNVMPALHIGNGVSRWDIIPFVGVGLIDNRTTDCRPFAFNYGVQGRYRISDALHITAELGNATTFKDADGIGSSRQFGDNLLSLSAGVSWTFGRKVGWKKVVDAVPYIQQNERLCAYAWSLGKRNKELERNYNANARIIAELRKILDIEGLLDKYLHCFDDENNGLLSQRNGYPVNDYSGLNSLRKRLRESEKTGVSSRKSSEKQKGKPSKNSGTAKIRSSNRNDSIGNNRSDNNANLGLADNYIDAIRTGNECLGAPIYFFFELGTTRLVDHSQVVNLNEIARIAMKYGLKIEVVGAADSLTGTEEINSGLGVSRARYIADYLMECGVEEEMVITDSEGGIDTYSPNEANRNATVKLYLP